MLDSEQWRSRVVADGQTLCPACQSMNLTMGACGIGSMTVHQEYVCEDCQYEFAALFGLTGCPRAQRADFLVGDTVAFTDQHLHERIGTIVGINQKTASVQCNPDEGHWGVSFALLRKVVDL